VGVGANSVEPQKLTYTINDFLMFSEDKIAWPKKDMTAIRSREIHGFPFL
jgi:hypothetical protein